jgi:hypothetical protein
MNGGNKANKGRNVFFRFALAYTFNFHTSGNCFWFSFGDFSQLLIGTNRINRQAVFFGKFFPHFPEFLKKRKILSGQNLPIIDLVFYCFPGGF